MDRLVEIDPTAKRRRRQHAERAGDRGRLVAQDVAEQVVAQHHVEAGGRGRQPHGRGVDIDVLERNVRILLRDLRHHRAPEARGFKHVRLVDRCHAAAALARAFEGHARHPFDLVTRVDQGIEGGVARRGEAARLAVVQAAQQFANDQQVSAAHFVRLERSPFRERGIADGRTQVGVAAERLPQRQQRRLRPLSRQPAVELGIADRAKQHGIGAQAGFAGAFGQAHAVAVDGDATNLVAAERECLAGVFCHVLQNPHGFGRDFGANAVAGKQGDCQ